jgi:hypothetical protein
VVGKLSISNKGEMDEDLGPQVDAWNGAVYEEVLCMPILTSENNTADG